MITLHQFTNSHCSHFPWQIRIRWFEAAASDRAATSSGGGGPTNLCHLGGGTLCHSSEGEGVGVG